SVIGGFLFPQYQLGRAAPPPPAQQISPASAEVLALVRDEHDVIGGYLKAQMAAEKRRHAAQGRETRRGVAGGETPEEKRGGEKTKRAKTRWRSKMRQTSSAQWRRGRPTLRRRCRRKSCCHAPSRSRLIRPQPHKSQWSRANRIRNRMLRRPIGSPAIPIRCSPKHLI